MRHPNHLLAKTTVLCFLIALLGACASFDRTNIAPGERVFGPGYSFETPAFGKWFASEYGTGNRMRLVQLENGESYFLDISMRRGPAAGMFTSAEAHLSAFTRHRDSQPASINFKLKSQHARVAPKYGELCIRYENSGADWAGRNNRGPALVDRIGLICAHPKLKNVLVYFELMHRHEVDMPAVNLKTLGEKLFSSIEYQDL